MSANQILPMIGGLAGKYVAGMYAPKSELLGSLGWFLGSMLLSQIGPTNKVQTQGNRLSDLSVQSSAYGSTIPLVFGTVKLSGNIIWGKPLHEVKRTKVTQQGKGVSGVRTTETIYDYYGRFAVALCEGPIEGVKRIWANGDLLFDQGKHIPSGKTYPMDLNGAMPDEGVELWPGVRLFFGTETQLPSSYIESFEGVGEYPAHRGIAYVVFEEFFLEKYGNSLPALEFEISNYVAYEVPETYTADFPEPSGEIPLVPENPYWSTDYDEATGSLAMRVTGAQGLNSNNPAIKQQPLYIQKSYASGITINLVPFPQIPDGLGAGVVFTVGGNAYVTFGSGVNAERPYIRVSLDQEVPAITSARLPNGYSVGPLLTLDNGGLPEVAFYGGKPHANNMSTSIVESYNLTLAQVDSNTGQELYHCSPKTTITTGVWPSITQTTIESPTLMATAGTAAGVDEEGTPIDAVAGEAFKFDEITALRPITWSVDGRPAGGWLVCDMGRLYTSTDGGITSTSTPNNRVARFNSNGLLTRVTQFDAPEVAIPFVCFIDPQRGMLVFPGAVIQLWDM